MIGPRSWTSKVLSNSWRLDAIQLGNHTKFEITRAPAWSGAGEKCTWGQWEGSVWWKHYTDPIKQGHFLWKHYYFYSLFTFLLQSTFPISLSLEVSIWLLFSSVINGMTSPKKKKKNTCFLKRPGLV